MRMNRRIVGFALLFGIVIWIVDGAVDYLFFYEGSLADNILLAVAPHELYIRLLIFLSFIVLGLIVNHHIIKCEKKHHTLIVHNKELDQIFNAVTDGLCLVTTDYVINRFNRAFAEMFEIDARIKGPLSCSRISCIPLCDKSKCPIRQLRDGSGLPVVTEFILTRTNGQLRTCLMTASPLYNQSGILAGAVCNYRDLTDFRQSIADKAQSEATLKTLLDAAPMGIGMVKDRVLGWTNGKFSEQTGYSHEELTGLPARKLYATREEYERVGREKYRDVIRKGIGSIVTQFIRKDGTHFDVLLSSSAIIPFDLSGGLVFTAIDITEQKKLEEQLYHSQKLETVGRLAGGIAHDFNNLLTIIYGVSQMAQMTLSENDPVYHDFNTIEQTAERASALIRHLLAFSRHQFVEPRNIDLNDGLRELDIMLRRLISENIQLTMQLGDDLWSVRIDPMQVEQILTNLVVNSRDAMPEGGSLTIETANVNVDENYIDTHVNITPGEYVMLSVTDTGIGMDEEIRSHIFEPFYTTKKHAEGTGLGLSTCYGIIKQNNGSIMVYSEKGYGTTIKILLPRISGDTTAFKLRTDITDIPSGAETILLAEDDRHVRETMSRTLRENGYTVMEAPDGETAFSIANEQQSGNIDLLITDIVMPNMGGRKLASGLTHADRNMKVLLISGYTEHAVRDQYTPDNSGFLQKPFTPADLLRKTREVLDQTSTI